MNNIRIIVTGGSGFIGTNLIEDLLEKGFNVLNIDIQKPKIRKREDIWKKIDIRNIKALTQCIFEYDPEYIIHLAARTDLCGKRIEDYDSNAKGTYNILQCSKQLNNLKKIVIASSMLVCKSGYQPKNQFDYKPSTIYGYSKVMVEEFVWQSQLECDWAIIRPTSIWGPWFGEPYRNFFDMVIKKRYFHIGRRSCTKTYGYVGNAVYEIENILFRDTVEERNKIFYIGDYEPTHIEVWADEIAGQLGYRIKRIPYWLLKCVAILGDCLKRIGISIPMTSFRLRNMTTDNVVNLNNTQIVVGDIPFTRIEGINETLDWIKRNDI